MGKVYVLGLADGGQKRRKGPCPAMGDLRNRRDGTLLVPAAALLLVGTRSRPSGVLGYNLPSFAARAKGAGRRGASGRCEAIMRRPMGGSGFAGAIALFAASLVWGMSFPAQTAASEVVGPFTFIAGKSSVACLFMVTLIVLRKVTRRRTKGSPLPASPACAFLASHRRVVIGGILCGLVLFVADNCQQAGISSYPPDAAASGRAGFLTATYVVIVALLARFLGRRLHPAVIVAVFVCLAGMYLLCVPIDEGFSGIYVGDGIMLASALFYAFHILAVGRFALEDALWLSCAQFFTSAALSSVCAFAVEGATPFDALPALLPILYVGIFSTGLGYTLQNIGQRTVDEAPAAILMSLESVFAALGGWALLGESMSGTELAGCALVFAAVLLAQLPQFKRARSSCSNPDSK